VDNDYKSRTGQSHIPVQGDSAPIHDPINPDTADSDETLGTCLNTHASLSFVKTFEQQKMTPMPLIRVTLLVVEPEVQSPVEGIRSQVMRRVYHRRTVLLQLARESLMLVWHSGRCSHGHIG